MSDILYAIGMHLVRLGEVIQSKAYPICRHSENCGIQGPAFFCADCGEMRSSRPWAPWEDPRI